MAAEERSDTDSGRLSDVLALGEVMTPLARRYYDIAVRNQQAAATGDPTYAGDHAVVAIFFALAALEAYLPEMAGVGPLPSPDGRLLSRVVLCKALDVRGRPKKNEIERQYATAAPACVAARAPWYRPCQCLRRLRNALMHYDSEFRSPGAWPEKLARQGCDKVIRGLGRSEAWAGQALTAEVGAWACTTARETIVWFHRCAGGAAPWDYDELLGGWSRLP
jgi:hypothetical protein